MIDGISWSVSPGITGATNTPVGTPALVSFSIAFNRAAGWAVRGSMIRASSASSVVTDKNTAAA